MVKSKTHSQSWREVGESLAEQLTLGKIAEELGFLVTLVESLEGAIN